MRCLDVAAILETGAETFPAHIEQLKKHQLEVWRQCPDSFPELPREYSEDDQIDQENGLERFFQLADRIPRWQSSERDRERVTGALREVATKTLDLDRRQADLLFEDFQQIGRDLASEARRDDPRISDDDIYQASRNAWTATALQTLIGGGMELTPSIYAYSMLYPYTDNFLDNPDISREEKKRFNERLAERLRGKEAHPAGEHEAHIHSLLDRIEDQYERAQFPEVHASLRAIQKAQTDSTKLRFGGLFSRRPDTLGISFEKGGASLLADGYLAGGRLSWEAASFAFGWGIVLQLGDDLQDVATDSADGIRTIFTEAARQGKPLDSTTNRLFHYTREVLARMSMFQDDSLAPLRGLIEISAWLLVIFAAGGAPQRFTQDYIRRLEQYAPLRFAFLERNRDRFAAHDGLLGGVCGGFCKN
jgi:hypothetical protein